MRDDDLLKRFNRAKEMAKEEVVIVEGKRDAEALSKSSVFCDVVMLNGREFEGLCSSLSGRKVVILTDFDKKGKEIAGKLAECLRAYDAKVDGECRRLFASLGILKIEELPSKIVME